MSPPNRPTRLPLAAAVLLPMAVGCTQERLQRSGYQMLYDRQCLVEQGELNCDPNHPSYDTYQQQRQQLLQPKAVEAPLITPAVPFTPDPAAR